MKRLRFPVLVLVALIAALATCSLASADSPTESPTPAPTVPRHTSQITVMYTYRGTPLIAIVEHLTEAYVNEELCQTGATTEIFSTIVDGTTWPWRPRRPCNETDATVRICVFGDYCSNEFVYVGTDVNTELPFPESPGIRTATAHFKHDGVIQPVTVTGWLFTAGSTVCEAGGTLPAKLSAVTIWWPLSGECGSSGADVSIRFTTEEFGELEGAFQWQGADIDYDVDTGELLNTATPTLSPAGTLAPTIEVATPTPANSSPPSSTPSRFPITGGGALEEGPPGILVVVGLAAVAAGVFAWIAATGRKRNEPNS